MSNNISSIVSKVWSFCNPLRDVGVGATLLRELSAAKGILGQIFTKSQNKIQDPAMLAKIIDMINSEQWLVMGADVKGDIYEN